MPKTKKSFLYKSSRVIVRGWYWICRKIKAFLVSIYWFPYYLYSKFKYQQQAVFVNVLWDMMAIIWRRISCDHIISESLHGLVIAETYRVPSCWVEFTRHADYWPFKYLDFYESIGNVNNNSVKLYLEDCEAVSTVREHLSSWKPSSISYQELLSFFPFELSEKRQLGN